MVLFFSGSVQPAFLSIFNYMCSLGKSRSIVHGPTLGANYSQLLAMKLRGAHVLPINNCMCWTVVKSHSKYSKSSTHMPVENLAILQS